MPAHPRPPQHCKQISMEMVSFTDGIQARIPRFSTPLPDRTVKQAADQWTKGLQRGLRGAQPVLPWPLGAWPRQAGRRGSPGRWLSCPSTVPDRASSSGESVSIGRLKTKTQLYFGIETQYPPEAQASEEAQPEVSGRQRYSPSSLE